MTFLPCYSATQTQIQLDAIVYLAANPFVTVKTITDAIYPYIDNDHKRTAAIRFCHNGILNHKRYEELYLSKFPVAKKDELYYLETKATSALQKKIDELLEEAVTKKRDYENLRERIDNIMSSVDAQQVLIDDEHAAAEEYKRRYGELSLRFSELDAVKRELEGINMALGSELDAVRKAFDGQRAALDDLISKRF